MEPQTDNGRSALHAVSDSLHHGDWDGVLAGIARLPQVPRTATPEELEEYLDDLQRVLLLARTSRADLATSLVRARAAAGFGDC